MILVERKTYADFHIMQLNRYRQIHGLIESYGGRVKDFQRFDEDLWIMFYELGKEVEAPFKQELKELFR